MTEANPIIILEDDLDDQEIMEEAFVNIGTANERIYFDSADTLYDFLMQMEFQPLIIISDVNLPKTTGLELKQRIDANPHLRSKTIPFVFFSTATNPAAVVQAYNLNSQGFFRKPTSIRDIEEIFRNMIIYWMFSKHPNNF